MKHFFVQHQHVFVNTKILFVQRQTFCFNTKLFFTKFLFWASFRMLCYGDIFLLSQQKYITCQKISYLCDTKKLISFFFFFLHHNFSVFIFYITHCQHVDLRRGDPENKKTFNPPFTQLSDIPKQLLTKSCS